MTLSLPSLLSTKHTIGGWTHPNIRNDLTQTHPYFTFFFFLQKCFLNQNIMYAMVRAEDVRSAPLDSDVSPAWLKSTEYLRKKKKRSLQNTNAILLYLVCTGDWHKISMEIKVPKEKFCSQLQRQLDENPDWWLPLRQKPQIAAIKSIPNYGIACCTQQREA
jgi:hypothetical protein